MKRLTLGPDGIFPIVDKINSKFYVLISPSGGYYVSTKYNKSYCLTFIDHKTVSPESEVSTLNSYFIQKTRQESLSKAVQFSHKHPEYPIYEFESRQEFLDSDL